VWALRNFPLHSEDAVAFHAHTGILTKTTSEVVTFATQLRRLCLDRHKGGIVIPEAVAKTGDAPAAFASSRAARAWTTMLGRDADALRARMEAATLVQQSVQRGPEEQAGFDTARFLGLVLEFGIDARLAILADSRFPFRGLLSVADLKFCLGRAGARGGGSAVPEFVFDEGDFVAFLRDGLAGDEGDEPVRVSFVMPSVTKLSFGMGHARPKKRRAPAVLDDAEEFAIGRKRRRL
jgi:hypothetical protein